MGHFQLEATDNLEGVEATFVSRTDVDAAIAKTQTNFSGRNPLTALIPYRTRQGCRCHLR